MSLLRWCFAAALAVLVTPLPPLAAAHAQLGPVIEEVEPTSGPPGTVVNVTGRRLAADATVSIAGTALPVLQRTANRLVVRIVDNAPSGYLAVTSASGSVRGPEFRVTPPPSAPVVDGIEPAKGSPGTRVVVRGRNFSPRLTGNVVTLAGQPVVLRSATPQQLELTVPARAASGPFVVRVEHAGEAQSAPFEILSATVIDAVSPERAAPHGELTIRGQGFSPVSERNRVYLGNVRLELKTASERELVVKLPGKVASGELLVDVEGGGRATAAEPVLVQLLPTLISFTPKSGGPGTVVTVRGTNFGTAAEAIEAKLGGVPLRVQSAKDTTLKLELPPEAKSERLSIRVHGVGPVWSEQPFAVQ